MNIKSLLPIALLGFIASTTATPPTADTHRNLITGDYVEARTASVFAGACHYNGERVTSGRQAICAWNITHGSWNGVDLSGIKAIAAIGCEDNLAEESAGRKSELVIDPSATDAQATAFIGFLSANESKQLGQIVASHRAEVIFHHDGSEYVVDAEGYAAMKVAPMPNNECCSQPHDVWYTPMMTLEHRKVGFTESASYTAGTVSDPWDRSEENSAFYGSFSIARR